MEVFAVFGGRLSLFNRELQQGDSELPNYVTLSTVFDPRGNTVDVSTKEFILYEARLDGIIGIFPHRTINIIEADGSRYTTVLYRVILDNLKNGFLVRKGKNGNKPVFKDKKSVGPEDLRDYKTIKDIVDKWKVNIEEINCSASRFDCPPTTGL